MTDPNSNPASDERNIRWAVFISKREENLFKKRYGSVAKGIRAFIDHGMNSDPLPAPVYPKRGRGEEKRPHVVIDRTGGAADRPLSQRYDDMRGHDIAGVWIDEVVEFSEGAERSAAPDLTPPKKVLDFGDAITNMQRNLGLIPDERTDLE